MENAVPSSRQDQSVSCEKISQHSSADRNTMQKVACETSVDSNLEQLFELDNQRGHSVKGACKSEALELPALTIKQQNLINVRHTQKIKDLFKTLN